MYTRHTCKITSPAGGNWNSTQGCCNNVAKGFPHVETFCRIFPNAVNTVSGIWFSKHFFPGNLFKSDLWEVIISEVFQETCVDEEKCVEHNIKNIVIYTIAQHIHQYL